MYEEEDLHLNDCSNLLHFVTWFGIRKIQHMNLYEGINKHISISGLWKRYIGIYDKIEEYINNKCFFVAFTM